MENNYEVILDSIRAFPKQIKQVNSEFNKKKIPNSCFFAQNIVVAGMGGSALGGRIIDWFLVEKSRVPIEVFNHYNLPLYVNNNSLVIISSYSGNTEETVEAYKQAMAKKAIVYAITSGGKLEEMCKKDKTPYYKIVPDNNPSQQPRHALGYSIFSILSLLSACEFIKVKQKHVESLVGFLNKLVTSFEADNSPPKEIAEKLNRHFPIIVSSEHLVGSSHSMKNQINETAKTFSVLFDLPEANHHLMEGLNKPESLKENSKFLFIESDKYTKIVQKRYVITREVVEKNNIETLVYKATSKTKLKQIFEIVVFGLFLSYYMSIENKVDPTGIPWVDYFKEKLAKQ